MTISREACRRILISAGRAKLDKIPARQRKPYEEAIDIATKFSDGSLAKSELERIHASIQRILPPANWTNDAVTAAMILIHATRENPEELVGVVVEAAIKEAGAEIKEMIERGLYESAETKVTK